MQADDATRGGGPLSTRGMVHALENYALYLGVSANGDGVSAVGGYSGNAAADGDGGGHVSRREHAMAIAEVVTRLTRMFQSQVAEQRQWAHDVMARADCDGSGVRHVGKQTQAFVAFSSHSSPMPTSRQLESVPSNSVILTELDLHSRGIAGLGVGLPTDFPSPVGQRGVDHPSDPSGASPELSGAASLPIVAMSGATKNNIINPNPYNTSNNSTTTAGITDAGIAAMSSSAFDSDGRLHVHDSRAHLFVSTTGHGEANRNDGLSLIPKSSLVGRLIGSDPTQNSAVLMQPDMIPSACKVTVGRELNITIPPRVVGDVLVPSVLVNNGIAEANRRKNPGCVDSFQAGLSPQRAGAGGSSTVGDHLVQVGMPLSSGVAAATSSQVPNSGGRFVAGASHAVSFAQSIPAADEVTPRQVNSGAHILEGAAVPVVDGAALPSTAVAGADGSPLSSARRQLLVTSPPLPPRMPRNIPCYSYDPAVLRAQLERERLAEKGLSSIAALEARLHALHRVEDDLDAIGGLRDGWLRQVADRQIRLNELLMERREMKEMLSDIRTALVDARRGGSVSASVLDAAATRQAQKEPRRQRMRVNVLAGFGLPATGGASSSNGNSAPERGGGGHIRGPPWSRPLQQTSAIERRVRVIDGPSMALSSSPPGTGFSYNGGQRKSFLGATNGSQTRGATRGGVLDDGPPASGRRGLGVNTSGQGRARQGGGGARAVSLPGSELPQELRVANSYRSALTVSDAVKRRIVNALERYRRIGRGLMTSGGEDDPQRGVRSIVSWSGGANQDDEAVRLAIARECELELSEFVEKRERIKRELGASERFLFKLQEEIESLQGGNAATSQCIAETYARLLEGRDAPEDHRHDGDEDAVVCVDPKGFLTIRNQIAFAHETATGTTQCDLITSDEPRPGSATVTRFERIFKGERALIDAVKSLSVAVAHSLYLHWTLQSVGTCKACLTPFTNPVTMWPCGHTLCMGCVGRIPSSVTEDQLQCTECWAMCEGAPTPHVAMAGIVEQQNNLPFPIEDHPYDVGMYGALLEMLALTGDSGEVMMLW